MKPLKAENAIASKGKHSWSIINSFGLFLDTVIIEQKAWKYVNIFHMMIKLIQIFRNIIICDLIPIFGLITHFGLIYVHTLIKKSCRIISKVNFPGLKSLGTKVAQSLGLQEKNKKWDPLHAYASIFHKYSSWAKAGLMCVVITDLGSLRH